MEPEQDADRRSARAQAIRAAGGGVGLFFGAFAVIRGNVESYWVQVPAIVLLFGIGALAWILLVARRLGPQQADPGEKGAFDRVSLVVHGGFWLSFVLSLFAASIGKEYRGELGFWVPAVLAIAIPPMAAAWWLARRVSSGSRPRS